MDKHGQPITVLAPDPAELYGRIFLMAPDELGNVNRGKILLT